MATQLNNQQATVNGSSGLGKPRYSTPDFFTTSKGKTIKFIGLNPARLEKLQSAGTMPSVPMRTIPNDLGSEQREPLTADSLQDDEERKQWAEYVEKRKKVEDKRNENVLRYVFHDGIAIEDEILDEWKRNEEEVWGLELPNNSVDLKVSYINSEIVGNADDLAEIMAGVMERTGVPATELDEVRATFRSDLRQSTAIQATAE